MARIRNIKPQFFKDADLYDAEAESGLPLRVAYAGLWTVADRAGRFKWKPREIKTDILPYDDVDMAAVMAALVKYGFIFKYKAAGFDYGFIPNFEKHQFINKNELASSIPAPSENIPEPSQDESEIENHCVTQTQDTDGLTPTPTQVVPPAVADVPPKPLVVSKLPDWLPLDAWSAYLEMRRKQHKTPTPHAMDLLLSKLDRWRQTGHDPTEILNYSTMNSYTGLFEPKANRNGQHQQKSANGHDKFFAAAASIVNDLADNGPAGDGDGVGAAGPARRPLLSP